MTPIDDLAAPRMTPADALRHAVACHQRGELDAAEALYTELLRREPRRPDVLNFMGLLQHQRGAHASAAELLRRAAQLAPREPSVWNNLGCAWMALDRLADADKAFRRGLALGDSVETLVNVARLQRRRQQWARSEEACRRALALAPTSGEAWHGLSLALLGQHRSEEAFAAAVQAELLLPPQSRRRQTYGRALSAAGEHERAIAFYRDWLAREPGNEYARHHLAASLGESPERASDAYVEQVFDQFAASFDAHLATLKYRAPELIEQALRVALPAPAALLDVADLGCGTGLAGPLVRPWARTLAGCDLSSGMLERAAERQAYDTLDKAELVRFLLARPGAFDVLVSADTFIYVGDLVPVFAAARGALRPGGVIAFTLECLPADAVADYRLTESGRYAHARTGVERHLAAAGFDLHALVEASARQEGGRAVAGWVVTACLR